MHVRLLTVADPEVGLGHLYRCDALAQAINLQSNANARLIVACTEGTDWLAKRAPVSEHEIEQWNHDADIARAAVEGGDVAVVDAYAITATVWEAIQHSARSLVAFDDTGEKPPFQGTLVNGSPGAYLVGYADIPGRTLLLGTDYQVLRPPFWKRSERVIKADVKKVVVMAGGTDHRGAADAMVAAALQALPPSAQIEVVGNYDTHDDPRVRTFGFLTAGELKELFDEADLLITAAGQTVAEAVSCALPTVMVQTAENQTINVKGWEETGAASFAAEYRDATVIESVTNTLERVISKDIRRAMTKKASQIDLPNSSGRLAAFISGVQR